MQWKEPARVIVALGMIPESTECFLEIVHEVEYLPRAVVDELAQLTDLIIGNLFGLLRKGIHTKVPNVT
jgi:hypothetical protein